MPYSAADNQTIKSFVQANLSNPQAIANYAYQNAISLDDLANASGISANEANAYFNKAGINTQYFQPGVADRVSKLGNYYDVAKSPFQTSVPAAQPQLSLVDQILASSDPTKWTGEGFGSAQANAADMAKILSGIGITDISQFGKVKAKEDTRLSVRPIYDDNGNITGYADQDNNIISGANSGNVLRYDNSELGPSFEYMTQKDVDAFGNKLTGQAVPNTYGERQTGDAFGGTYAGSGNTGYRVQFRPDGSPVFYTSGQSSSSWGDVAPFIGIAAAAFGVPGLIGSALAPAAGAATQAALGGAVLGGGMAGAGGGNVLKGALLGGAGGYLSSQLGGAGSEYNFNGPAATSPTMADLTGAGQLTGLDQYMVGPTLSDLAGTGGASMGGYDPVTNTNGYYDEITGKFIQDPNGPLQGPLDNTSGTNLSSMNGYNYDPASGTWTMPDGTQVATTPGSPYKSTSGADVLKSAGAGLAGAGLAGGAGAAAGGGLLSGLTTGSALADAALISGASGLAGNAITNSAIKNSIANTTAAAQQAGSTLKDIYNQQLGFVQPYQQLGQQGVNAITAQMPYLQHQFNAQDLAAGLAPNYDFMLQQGQMANQRAANVGGGALGGNALQGLNKFTQDYAGNAYQNAFNNYQTQRNNIYNTLAGIAGMGQTANQQAIGAGTNYGQQQTNLTTGLAAAQAGANVGQAQNTSNLISNLGNNLTLASLLGQKQAVV